MPLVHTALLKKLKKNENSNANAPAKLCDLFGDGKKLEGTHIYRCSKWAKV
jgi:hypothetical protein